MVLEGQVYAESLAYDATKEEIRAIVGILRHTKDLMTGYWPNFLPQFRQAEDGS